MPSLVGSEMCIRDRINGEEVWSTGGLVSGSGTADIQYPGGNAAVDVHVEGPNDGTAWEATISCCDSEEYLVSFPGCARTTLDCIEPCFSDGGQCTHPCGIVESGVLGPFATREQAEIETQNALENGGPNCAGASYDIFFLGICGPSANPLP